MPMVPVVNQNPTNTPDVQGPNVAPMRNYAPEQIQQTGETMQNAGLREMSVGQHIALRIQEQLDDANVKAAENQFIQSATDILHGQNGYMNKQGADALNGYDQASEAIVKAKKDVLESLGNDVQKHMFDRVSQTHLVTLGAQMSAHRAQQRIEYSAGQSLARADSMRSMAQNSDIGSADQNNYIETGVQEIRNALSYKGIPADSEEAKKAERAFRSQITQDNVSRLMEDGKYEDANKLLTEQMKAGNVEGDTGDRLRRAIRGNLIRTQNIEKADSIFAPYQDKQLRGTDLEEMLNQAAKIDNPESRQHVQDLVRAKFNEVHSLQAQEYRDNLNDVVNYKAKNGTLKGVDPVMWGKLDASDQAELMKPPAQQTDLDTWYTFVTKPDSLTLNNVNDAYARGLLTKGDFKNFTELAVRAQNKSDYVQEAGGINDRIDYFASRSGLKVYDAKTPEDKAQIGALKYKVQTDIDKYKAQNHGKITSEQVDKIITNELTQQTLTKRGWIWDSKITKYNFEAPAGAVGTESIRGVPHWKGANGEDLGEVK